MIYKKKKRKFVKNLKLINYLKQLVEPANSIPSHVFTEIATVKRNELGKQ